MSSEQFVLEQNPPTLVEVHWTTAVGVGIGVLVACGGDVGACVAVGWAGGLVG